MHKGLRAKQNFYEDYSGYSEEELDEKLKTLGIDVNSFAFYNSDMPIHEFKSMIIQDELFRLKDTRKDKILCKKWDLN